MEFQPTEEYIESLQHFSQEVTIEGLPYIFQGNISQNPSGCHWEIIVPNWQKQAEKIKENIETRVTSITLSHKLDEFERKRGSIGDITIYIEKDNIGVLRIETNTWILPEEYGYEDASGVGSFLLKNLLAFADFRNVPVFLTPYPDTNSPLSDDDTARWYERNDFQWIRNVADRNSLPEEYENYSMIRLPQKLDLSQPIVSILQKNKLS